MSAYEALNGPYDWNRYPMAPLGCKAASTKTATSEDRGLPEVWMDGTSARHRITTGVTYIMSPKLGHTEYQGRQNSFPNTVNSQI